MKTTLCKRGSLFLGLCILIAFGACQPPEVEKPKTTISEEKATELSSRFVEEITTLMDQAKDTSRLKNVQKAGFVSTAKADFNFASHTYYSIEQLEHYFAWAKQEAKAKGYNLEGFRFYFGIYPDDDDLGEKRNFMTMFISPAGRKTGRQEGATFKIPYTTIYSAPEVIRGVDPDNYGGLGDPPHAVH